MPRIAHVVSNLAPGSGLTHAVLDIAAWQGRLGASVTLVTGVPSGGNVSTQDAERAGVNVASAPICGPLKLAYAPELPKLVSRMAPQDIFVLHGSYQYPTFVAARHCQRLGLPFIFMPHGSLDPSVRQAHPLRNKVIDGLYHDRLISSAAGWHFTSVAEMEGCERRLWKSAFVEPLGFEPAADTYEVGDGGLRRSLGLPADGKVFLFLSRVTRKKGVGILIDAFRRVRAQGHNAWLVVCGPIDADQASAVERAKADALIAPYIRFTGLVQGAQKRAAFQGADAFILPTFSENFGIAVFEAMSFGLPVITTTGMDLHDELETSGRVLIVEPTIDAVAEGMVAWLTGHWSPTGSGVSARDWIESRFSWRQRAKAMLDHYENTLSRRLVSR